MDPLSGAASVIAVIQISSKVIALCTQYSKAVWDAKDDIDRLQNIVEGVKHVLEGIKEMLDGADAQKRLMVSQQLSKPLADCTSQLETISYRLEPGKRRKVMSRVGLRAFKWPFKSKELDRLIITIERNTQILSAALQVDQT